MQNSIVCTASTQGSFPLGLCFTCFVYQHFKTLLPNKAIKVEAKLVNAGIKRKREIKKQIRHTHYEVQLFSLVA